MTESATPSLSGTSDRLLSLDLLRGLIMVILVLGETNIFYHLFLAFPNSFTQFISDEFQHSKWRGLHFWDLLLPAFMLIAGTSMALSYAKQQQRHASWSKSFWKTLKRSFWLLFFGILIYSVLDNKLNLQFSNVLTELSFATLIAFLVIRLKPGWQLAVSILLLLLTAILYRFTHVPGFDQPFTDEHNFGNYLDVQLIGKVNINYGTTLNMLPAAATTIWGLMAGQCILSDRSDKRKIEIILAAGLLTVLTGFALDITGVDPMLKWISSGSFVCATGGIALISLAFFYYRIDLRKHQRYLFFFLVVGMNSIFIYLFFNFFGGRWMNGFITTIVSGLLSFIGVQSETGAVFSCLVIFFMEWWLCYFLYKKKIFFRL